MSRVAIMGNASWGTTLGVVLARKGTQVKLWARTEEEANKLNESRENAIALPGIRFPPRLVATHSPEDLFQGAGAVIFAVPAQRMRQNIRMVRDYLEDSMLLVSAAKGLELDSGKRMSEVIAEEIGSSLHPNICVLSGPNIAREIAQGLPAATVVAAQNPDTLAKARKILSSPKFFIFTSNDVVGVELGGALKNLVALGAGISDGLGYGDNTKAAFITWVLTEITCLGKALGADTSVFL